MTLISLRKTLRDHSDPKKAVIHSGYFKTGKGEYAEGDRFIGITMPVQRKIASEFAGLPHSDLEKLLHSGIHEERMCALLILIHQYNKGTESERDCFFRFYLKNTAYINNWDLVDVSAEHIVGRHIFENGSNASILFERAASKLLWDRRIAMLASFYFIKKKSFDVPLALAGLLIHDPHDLIHKAVGWMLREIGKRDHDIELTFLEKHYAEMPRTMLRYAIEKFPEKIRKNFLHGISIQPV